MIVDLVGQNKIYNRLIHAYKTGRLAHAYLFAGTDGVGKDALAIKMARYILCADKENPPCGICSNCTKINKANHPDFYLIFPVSSKTNKKTYFHTSIKRIENPYDVKPLTGALSITIDDIRELKRMTSFKSFSSEKRVIIISEADKMTEQASNSVLKLLEEPPKNVYLFLTTENIEMILPTIRSRCQLLKFSIVDNELIKNALIKYYNIEDLKAEELSFMADGNFKLAIKLIDENLEEKMNFFEEFIHKSISGKIKK